MYLLSHHIEGRTSIGRIEDYTVRGEQSWVRIIDRGRTDANKNSEKLDMRLFPVAHAPKSVYFLLLLDNVYKHGVIISQEVILSMAVVHADPLQHKPTPYVVRQDWERGIDEMLDTIEQITLYMTRLIILIETWAYVSVVPRPRTYIVFLCFSISRLILA